MWGVLGWESLQVPRNWRRRVFVGNPCDGSSRQSSELLHKERVPSRGAPIFRRIHKLSTLYSSRNVKCLTGDELFLPCHLDYWDDHAHLQLFVLLLERILEKGGWRTVRLRCVGLKISILCKICGSSSLLDWGISLT